MALAPVAAVVVAAVAFVRFLSRMDELQRRFQLVALAFGFGGAGLLTFTYGRQGIGVAVGNHRYR